MTNSLSTRVVLLICAIASILAIAASVSSYYWIHKQIRRDAISILEQLADAVNRSASVAAYLDNKEIAEDVIYSLSDNDWVFGVSIKSKTGLYVHSSTPAEKNSSDDGMSVHIELYSPFSPQDVVGELMIIPNSTLIDQQAREQAIQRAVMLVIFILFFALLLILVLQNQLLSPLHQVASNLRRLEPGTNEQVRTPRSHEKDEIGLLVNTLNQLLLLIHDKLESERNLRLSVESLEKRFRMIFEFASVGIFLLNSDGQLVMSNPAFRKIVGEQRFLRLQNMPQNILSTIFQNTDKVYQLIHETGGHTNLASGDFQLKKGDLDNADQRWVNCLFTRVLDEEGSEDIFGEAIVQGIIKDITYRKMQENIISHEAAHDPLTQLRNRRSAKQMIDDAITSSHGKINMAMALLDLDNFKPINDQHGHAAGDIVLIEIANRINALLTSNEFSARLGGDEFLVIFRNFNDQRTIERRVDELINTITQKIFIPPKAIASIGVSIGISFYGRHGNEFTQLLSSADQAMYNVKRHGKNGMLVASG